jgi:two-component system sensor histidine kinase KdpD
VNIAMLFLLAGGAGGECATAAVRPCSRRCSGVVSFDFFFVEPRLSFAVSDVQYLVTFLRHAGGGLDHRPAHRGIRYQARVAAQRESRVRALFELARELSQL